MSFTEKFSQSCGRLKMIRNATSNMILLLCDLKNCLKKDWSFVDWIKTDIRQKDKNSHTLRIKVIIRKSRGEASIIEQETTENVSAAYLKFRTFILCNSLVRGCYNIWKKCLIFYILLKFRVWWTGFLQATHRASYTGSKNPVQTRKNIQFIKLGNSN